MNPFYRVDNRLVHGQIIATWMPFLRLQRILVVSDTVPENRLQMTMFRMAIPQQLAFEAMHVKDAGKALNARTTGTDRTLILLETVADAVRLFHGHPFPMLNIGNVHHAPDRKHFTNAVYLSEHELAELKTLMDRGVRVEIRSLPTEPAIDLRNQAEAH